VAGQVQQGRDLIQLGAYVPGSDPELDAAVKVHPQLVSLLQQGMHEQATLEASCRALQRLNPAA
jgi:flagellum-specific ATP synthase